MPITCQHYSNYPYTNRVVLMPPKKTCFIITASILQKKKQGKERL